MLVLALVSCGKDGNTDAEQAMLNKLQGIWVVGDGVFVDGVNATALYPSFFIEFNDDAELPVYHVNATSEAFPVVTDSYVFTNESYTEFTRESDGVEFTLELPDKNSLILSFTILPDEAPVRTEGTFGEFRFHLVKN